MPLVIPCPAQRWEDSLKCKGGISRVLLTFSLSLCVNLASCAAMRWTELFSSLHLASSTSQAEQKAVLIASELLRTMRSLQAGVSLYPCQWPCSQRRLRGTVCKQVPRTCALHAPAHMCALLSHLYTDGYTQTQLPGGQEFCWKFLGEMIQFLCVSTGLFTFISSYTWIPNVFLFVYSATGPFKAFFFAFPVKAGMQILFSSPSPMLTLCCCLPAEEAPDGEQDNDKLTKSPPPPPPRRSYLPGSGLTTTRSGDVIYTARKEAAALKVWWFIL